MLTPTLQIELQNILSIINIFTAKCHVFVVQNTSRANISKSKPCFIRWSSKKKNSRQASSDDSIVKKLSRFNLIWNYISINIHTLRGLSRWSKNQSSAQCGSSAPVHRARRASLPCAFLWNLISKDRAHCHFLRPPAPILHRRVWDVEMFDGTVCTVPNWRTGLAEHYLIIKKTFQIKYREEN